MRLLLVEDQTMAADYIAKGLRENDFVVDVAHDGVDGLHFLLTNDYDLAILDVMLPGMNGWKILSWPAAGKMTPVMFLTARDDVEDRVCGLELGAEDYLIKPFSFSELLASTGDYAPWRASCCQQRGGCAADKRSATRFSQAPRIA